MRSVSWTGCNFWHTATGRGNTEPLQSAWTWRSCWRRED